MKPIDAIVNSIKEFPTLPTIFTLLQEAISNPNSNINDVASIIERDQASVSKLLKLANSSIFGFRSRIASVPQAILYIGFEEVKNLLLTLKIIQVFHTKTKDHKIVSPTDFWKHSIASGVISKLIGMNIGMKSTETLFISGVLHNMGRLLFYISLPDEYVKVLALHKSEKIPLIDAERKVLGISNTLAAEMLAQKWKLPIQITDVIKNYNIGYIEEKINLNAAVVHIADTVASIFQLGEDGRFYLSKPNEKVWDLIKLPNNFFSTNFERLVNEYEENCEIFLNNFD